MKFANLVKICLWLHLAVKGLMIWHVLNGNQKRFTVEVSPGAYVTDKPSERLHKHENPCKRETSACRVNKIG